MTVFDRSDRVANLCEMKFVSDEFSIDEDYGAKLRRKVERFIKVDDLFCLIDYRWTTSSRINVPAKHDF